MPRSIPMTVPMSSCCFFSAAREESGDRTKMATRANEGRNRDISEIGFSVVLVRLEIVAINEDTGESKSRWFSCNLISRGLFVE